MIRESLLAFTMIAGANHMDAISTQHVVQAGGVEAANPGLYGPRAERIVPMKLAVSAAETGGFLFLRKHHKKAAWLYVGVVVAGNLYFAHRNEELARRMRGAR